jgi:hypothetical protein
MVIAILLTRNLETLIPALVGFGTTSVWLVHEAWPIVGEAWSGFAALR